MDKKFRYELDKEDLQCHIKSNRVWKYKHNLLEER
jgi:hypothetical protein